MQRIWEDNFFISILCVLRLVIQMLDREKFFDKAVEQKLR